MKHIHSTLLFFLIIGVLSAALSGCQQVTSVSAATDSNAQSSALNTDGAFTTEGKVVPVRYVQLSFSTSGVIESVLVGESETAGSDQVIARLEGIEHMESAVAQAEMELLAARQTLDDLHKNADLSQSNAQLVLAKTEKAYDDAVEELEKSGWRHGNQDAIDKAYAEYLLADRKVEEAERDFNEVSSYPENDELRAGRLSVLADARSTRDRTLRNWEYVKSNPDEFEVAEKEGLAEVARAEMEDAQREWELLKESGLDPEDIAMAEIRLKNAEAQLKAARSDLDDVELEAPFNGLIVDNELKTGEFVSPGGASVTLADVSAWQIETTDLTELEVVHIVEGMPVSISLEALPNQTLNGTVSRIKPLGENKLGDITYAVVIELDENNENLLWNMTADITFRPLK